MVVLHYSLVLIFLVTFPCRRSHIYGSALPTEHSVQTTMERENVPGLVKMLDPEIPQKDCTYAMIDSESRSQPNRMPCLSLCCAVNEVRNQGVCVDHHVTADIVYHVKTKIDNDTTKEVSEQNFHFHIGNPCGFHWMVPTDLEDFHVLENGSIIAADSDDKALYGLENYCLFRNSESIHYLARVCFPVIRRSNWDITCSFMVIFTLTIVVVVYTVIPEQRNLHGTIFRSHIVTYLGTSMSAMALELTTESRTNPFLYTCSETLISYLGNSCLFWLNVMSFNIWQAFRSLQPVHSNIKQQETRKYIRYAICAWGGPAVIVTAIFLSVRIPPHLRYEKLGFSMKMLTAAAVAGISYICNALMFILMVITIRNQRKYTADILNDTNKHRDIDEHWFNCYVKLFVLLGWHIVSWLVVLVWPSPVTIHILSTMEVVQAILLFTIFVWKEDIRRSFCQQLAKIVKM